MNYTALPRVLERDFPQNKTPTCLYCGRRLKMVLIGYGGRGGNDKPVLDHLDGNDKNDRYGNLALAHRECAHAKCTDKEYQSVAHAKIAENAECVPPPHMKRTSRLTSVQKSSITYDAVEAALAREVSVGKEVIHKDFCGEVSSQLLMRYGFGDVRKVREVVDVLCVSAAPWQITLDDKMRKVISRKPGR